METTQSENLPVAKENHIKTHGSEPVKTGEKPEGNPSSTWLSRLRERFSRKTADTKQPVSIPQTEMEKKSIDGIKKEIQGISQPEHPTSSTNSSQKPEGSDPTKTIQKQENSGKDPDSNLDIENMVQIRPALGTNPGGIFKENETGREYYVKQYPDRLQTSCEYISNRIYNIAGINVLPGMIVKDGDTIAFATEFKKDLKKLPQERISEAKEIFAAAAFLLDWDAVGTGPENPFGNLQTDENGKLILIDHGGSLLFRGLQGRKNIDNFSFDKIEEFTSLRSNLNPKSKEIFGGLSDQEIFQQVKNLLERVNEEDIRSIIAESRIEDPKTNEDVTTLLLSRRKALGKYIELSDESNKLELNETYIKTCDPFFIKEHGKTYLEWYDDKLLSTLEKSGNPGKDLTDFFCKSMTSLAGIDTPYKNLFSRTPIKDTPFFKRGIRLDYLMKLMPNYNETMIFEALHNHPYLERFEDKGKSFIALSEKAYRKYIYRGEAGANSLEGKKLDSTFDIYLNQGGIGYENMVNTAIDPTISLSFMTHEGGFFIIKDSALRELKNEPTNTGETLQLFDGIMPLRYVERFIVSDDIKNIFFEKYGPENTEIFGRPLKDVIATSSNNKKLFKSEILKLIIETNTDRNRDNSSDKTTT